MKKIRLDQFLVQENLAEQKMIVPMIMAGEIYVNGQKATSPAQMVIPDNKETIIEIKSFVKKYVSRGGFKLEKALSEFNINVEGLTCADFGASTGGFTDVLLQNGALKVYSIETAVNELDQKIKNNPKVISLEGTSLFFLEYLPLQKNEKIDLAVCDLSFITLKRALPKIFELTNNAPIIALLKPHYEAHDESLLRNGVVKDNKTREQIVNDFKNWCANNEFKIEKITESPIKGGGGNIEYLCYITKI